MKCKYCGFLYKKEDNYFNNCGKKVKNIGKIDIGLIIILIFGFVSFSTIGYLTYYSLTTIGRGVSTIEEDYYAAITGEWIDHNHINLIRLSNKGTYNWFQDYNNNKNTYLSGSMNVKIKNDALNEANITLDNVKQLFNLGDITEENIYLLKLFTTNKDNQYSYYKLLCVERDKELFIYNYNDKTMMQLVKNI